MQSRQQGGRKIFRSPFKNVLDKVLKIWAPLRKLFFPFGVPSWLRAWYHDTVDVIFSQIFLFQLTNSLVPYNKRVVILSLGNFDEIVIFVMMYAKRKKFVTVGFVINVSVLFH